MCECRLSAHTQPQESPPQLAGLGINSSMTTCAGSGFLPLVFQKRGVEASIKWMRYGHQVQALGFFWITERTNGDAGKVAAHLRTNSNKGCVERCAHGWTPASHGFSHSMCFLVVFCVVPGTYIPPLHSTTKPGFPVPMDTDNPGVRKAARFGVYQYNNSSNDLFLFKEWQINKAMVQVRHTSGGPPNHS